MLIDYIILKQAKYLLNIKDVNLYENVFPFNENSIELDENNESSNFYQQYNNNNNNNNNNIKQEKQEEELNNNIKQENNNNNNNTENDDFNVQDEYENIPRPQDKDEYHYEDHSEESEDDFCNRK